MKIRSSRSVSRRLTFGSQTSNIGFSDILIVSSSCGSRYQLLGCTSTLRYRVLTIHVFFSVLGCTDYGTTYQRFPNRALDDPDGMVTELIFSILQCTTLCQSHGNGCRGVNYNAEESRCMVVWGTPLNMPSEYIPHTEVDYYTRNCHNNL